MAVDNEDVDQGRDENGDLVVKLKLGGGTALFLVPKMLADRLSDTKSNVETLAAAAVVMEFVQGRIESLGSIMAANSDFVDLRGSSSSSSLSASTVINHKALLFPSLRNLLDYALDEGGALAPVIKAVDIFVAKQLAPLLQQCLLQQQAECSLGTAVVAHIMSVRCESDHAAKLALESLQRESLQRALGRDYLGINVGSQIAEQLPLLVASTEGNTGMAAFEAGTETGTELSASEPEITWAEAMLEAVLVGRSCGSSGTDEQGAAIVAVVRPEAGRRTPRLRLQLSGSSDATTATTDVVMNWKQAALKFPDLLPAALTLPTTSTSPPPSNSLALPPLTAAPTPTPALSPAPGPLSPPIPGHAGP